MEKLPYIEPLISVLKMSAIDYVLTASGNAPSIDEDPDARFGDY